MSTVSYQPTWPQDVYLIEIGIPGPPGTGFTAAEAAQARTDLNTLLARPNISTLESLTNVPTTGVTNGQTIIWNGTTWVYGNPNSSLTYVQDSWSGTPRVDNTTILTFGPGIKAEQLTASGGVRAHMSLQFAGTGTATTASKSDHSHAAVIQQLTAIPYQGTHTSGTKTISPVGFAVTGLTAAETYDVDVTVNVDIIAAGVDSRFAFRISIGTGSFQGYEVKFKGDGKVVTVKGVATGVTGVTSLPVVVNSYYAAGPQIEIGEGQIIAIAKPRR